MNINTFMPRFMNENFSILFINLLIMVIIYTLYSTITDNKNESLLHDEHPFTRALFGCFLCYCIGSWRKLQCNNTLNPLNRITHTVH